MKNEIKRKSFRSFYLAAFLFCKGFPLVSIEFNTPKRADFVFEGDQSMDELIDKFNFAEKHDEAILVDAREFVMAIKMLKDKLYQGRL